MSGCNLPAARMIPFTESRPVWILGFDAVMSRFHSGASSSSSELGDLAHKAASRNLALAEQRWLPELYNQIAEAVRGGIDARWLVLSRPGVAILRMIAEALPDDVPDIPILTELDIPAQYRLPLRGLAGTDIDPGWESEAVTALVPQDVPLFWIPSFQCACDWEYDCGSDRVDRTTKGVVQRRTGETTVITAKTSGGRITFMTDHDMETITRWVRANEQRALVLPANSMSSNCGASCAPKTSVMKPSLTRIAAKYCFPRGVPAQSSWSRNCLVNPRAIWSSSPGMTELPLPCRG